jgi:hypothetical protein
MAGNQVSSATKPQTHAGLWQWCSGGNKSNGGALRTVDE